MPTGAVHTLDAPNPLANAQKRLHGRKWLAAGPLPSHQQPQHCTKTPKHPSLLPLLFRVFQVLLRDKLLLLLVFRCFAVFSARA
jgi:hypothetical protein